MINLKKFFRNEWIFKIIAKDIIEKLLLGCFVIGFLLYDLIKKEAYEKNICINFSFRDI